MVPARAREGIEKRLPAYTTRRLRGMPERRWALDSQAPEPVAGHAIGPPDFVGIGAMKSGTSWWYERVSTHPDVYDDPRIHKEVHFFDRFADEEFSERAVGEYAAWFGRPPGKQRGEWTPTYIQDRWVLDLVARAAPDARILVLLRDPVPRLMSHLNHIRRSGRVVDTHSLARSIDSSLYFDRLTDVFAAFPRDRVLVQQYEKCIAEPAVELSRTLEFLGLDPEQVELGRSDGGAPPAQYTTQLPAHIGPVAIPVIEEQARRAADEFGCIDLALWSC